MQCLRHPESYIITPGSQILTRVRPMTLIATISGVRPGTEYQGEDVS
jgi:hypothetical protein